MRTPVILANAGVPMRMIAFPAAFFLLIPIVWIEWRIARRLTGITSAAKIVGVAVANAVSMLAGWPLMWMALAALQIKLDPHGLSWPDFPPLKKKFFFPVGRLVVLSIFPHTLFL